MSKNKSKSTMTDVLKTAIEESGLTPYRISKDTGVVVTSIIRFINGETSLRLDKADAIAEYLGLRLSPLQKPSHKQR
jgi:plasmid maintenance system antidote protein VapI